MTVVETATDRAYLAIRSAIFAGNYRSGQPIREEEIAESAGVSRTPVREALRRLEAEGQVELLPNRGARVAHFDAHDLDEIFELRVQLEGYGARLAANSVTRQQLQVLEQLAIEMEREVASTSRRPRFDRITDLNNRFHQAVLEAGGNRRLSAVVATVVHPALVTRTFHLYSPAQLRRSFSHHRELLDALSEGDPDWAEAVMRAHLFAGRRVTQSKAE